MYRATALFRLGSIAVMLQIFSVPGHTADVPQAEPVRPFRFGFSTSLLREFNENDAKASMRVWVQAVVKERNLPADPEARMLSGMSDLRAAVQNQAMDGFVMPLDEFWALKEPAAFNRFVFSSLGGSITEEYVLLVHKASGLSRLEDLHQRSLGLFQHSKMSLAVYWLDSLLMQKGLKPSSQYFGRITEFNKLTKTVLPVFFRQQDACILTRKGFKTMIELNPQIGQQLQVLTASGEFVPTLVCFRAGYPPEIQSKFITEFTALHKTPSGQQVLTVFQTDRLEEHPFSCLTNSLALLDNYARLQAGTNAPQLSGLLPAAREGFVK